MTLLIGIDEAGYGPNFGPLCIGATAWHVEERGAGGEERAIELYDLLSGVICRSPKKNRIAIADSKQLYKPGGGLRELERGVLAALASLGETASDWRDLLDPPKLRWYGDFNCQLPIDADLEEIVSLAEQFRAACRTARVKLVDLRARLVFPKEFNDLTERYGTKGAALSHVSIELVRKILARNSRLATRNSITCDKHGGRNRYAALLQHHFPDHWIETIEESRPVSRYRWGPPQSPTEICFRTKGEAELPVALASMTAKYHRELAMRAFNAFWAAQIPGIKPTAGYPQDARRFKAEIEAVQSKLGIADAILWRNR
ncbi:MAG: hypothetical protein ACR2NM_05405 [Bythopirellula sp.]